MIKSIDGKIRLGLVGLGFGGHLAEREIFSDAGGGEYMQIVAACDLASEKAEAYAKKHGLKACDNIGAILTDPEIEAVGLFTPPANRADLIRKCIYAGKHVMTTKPFELDPEKASKILREAEEAGITVHLNSPGPCPSIDLAKVNEWRKKYNLGQPIAARWETYCRYYEKADGSWFDDPEKCPVAPIFRLGIYGINELIAIIGKVATVQVSKSKIFTGRPTPDNAELCLHFKNGAIGSVFASLCVGDGCPYPANLIVHFENGTITKKQIQAISGDCGVNFKSVEMRLQCLCKGKFVEESYEFSPADRSGAYQWKYFHDVIRNGKVAEEQVKPETVAMGIAVIQAMAQAEKSGKAEPVMNY